MTTAYTSLLGLALPVTGELSGTWGDTVNTAITTLLDSAVAGTTSLTSDADVTLTTTTGASNQARQAILLWTAGGSTTRNITAPAQSKAYFVINKTSSTQSIVIRGAGPTTGVTVLAGTQSLVVWDGADFVEVASGNVDGPASSTDNAVARFDGTTGKLIQNSVVTIADTSGNMAGVGTLGVGAITTSGALTYGGVTLSNSVTGTGSMVLDTSPTLVTPALGTPASGVVTNLTGTASININGTVGATTANTGAFTTLSASGDVTLSGATANGVVYANGSKVLTSGSALTFDGSTLGVATAAGLLANLNSTEANGPYIRFQSSGTSVGDIGTAAQVAGGSISDFAINARGTGNLVFARGFSEQMRLTSTGLGIGTSSPSSKLTVAIDDATGTLGARVVGVTDPNRQLRLAYNTTGNHASIQAIHVGTAYTNLVLQQDGGNVGIGTSSPGTRLHVQGGAGQLMRVTDGTTGASIYSGGGLFGFNNQTGEDGMFGSTASHYLYFATNGAERMRLDTSGNLGLGVTPSAWGGGKAVEVGFAGRSLWGFTQAVGYETTNAYYNSGFKYGGTGAATAYAQDTGSHIWYTAPSGTAGNAISFTQAMTLTAAGDLLVGTTSAIPAGSGTNDGFCVYQGGVVGISAENDRSLFLKRRSSDGNIAVFYRDNTSVGSISVTTSATAYNTSSDYRLKNITGPITNSGAYIDSLNPVEGIWKADGSTFVGLIAHEVQEASRTTVATGVKDGEEMQGMDYSNAELIANLIAEIQSLRQRLAAAGI